MPNYEIADRGASRPASVLKRARSFMSPEEAAEADRKRRLEELEAPYREGGDDMPPAA